MKILTVLLALLIKVSLYSQFTPVNQRFKNEEYGYYKNHSREITLEQSVEDVNLIPISPYKYGCGMHTLYSKSFWEFVTIPDELGGYGPEDTYGMEAAKVAIKLGYDIKQFVMDGVYITEDYVNRTPSFVDKIKPIDKKKEFYDVAYSKGPELIRAFAKDLIEKQSNS